MPMLCTIIGAGPGLGAAIAARFASESFDIALVARNREGLDAIIESDEGLAACGCAFPGDVADTASLAHALQEIRAWRGESDVLVYNASQMLPDEASSLTSENLLTSMRINVGGALDCIQDTLPAMRSRRSGTILLTGGGLALEPYPDWASLGAGKAALRNLAIGLHKELKPDGIHVAIIAICGIVEPGGPLDPRSIADLYWDVHAEPIEEVRREVVYMPQGADPYYNDPDRTYRATSEPIIGDEHRETRF